MNRRDLFGGGMAAGFAGLTRAEMAAGGQGDDPRLAASLEHLTAITQSHYEVTDLRVYNAIGDIRTAIRQHLLANHKYPDFIEVGIDIWETVYDWHIQHGLPLEASRYADGRYAIKFMFTTLLMRTDATVNFMGVPFDGGGRPSGGAP